MVDVIDDFRARVSRNGSYSDGKSGLFYNMNVDFEESLNTDPSAIELEIYKPEEQFNNVENLKIKCIVNEIATNDQKSFDEKYILTRKSDEIKFGMYIKFDGWYWIVNFKEHQTHDVYDKHVMRRCNNIVKYNVGNKMHYGIPVVAKNLTQYSDGMQDIKYTSMSDGKVSMMFGVNSITRGISLGDRFIINNNAYRVTFIENYQFSEGYDSKGTGLGNMIMIYDPKHSTDNIELGVDTKNDSKNVPQDIVGSTKIVPSGRYKYKFYNIEDGQVWDIEYGDKSNFITITDTSTEDEMSCVLNVNYDMNNLDEVVTLVVTNSDKSKRYAELKLNVTVF